MTGRSIRDPRLDIPTTPKEAGLHLWELFWRLNSSRGSSQFGHLPIAYTEILAYSTLYRQPLDIWELDTLRAMDDTWLRTINRIKSEEQTE